MFVEAQLSINGSKAAIWAVITDIEHAATILSGVESIEIVNKPGSELVGLRWKETRILFGKPATVEKWITDAVENDHYTTRAEDGGFVFVTTQRIAEAGGGMALISSHDSQPQGIGAKFMSIPMRLFFRGVLMKAVVKDLMDYKAAVERN